MMGHQLPLKMQLRDDATLGSFYVGNNEAAFAAIQQILRGREELFLYLWGNAGVGKTHLLQAVCQAASATGTAALYIPLNSEQALSVQLLQDIESVPIICLDDIQRIAGHLIWEEALFHLYNRMQLQHGRLLMTADVAPTHLPILLPDLKSRLTAVVSYPVLELNDEQKINALRMRAAQRGLRLTMTVGRFLLNRCPRNMSDLFHALEMLDEASLAEQRRLTIPFVKQILSI